MGETQSSQFSGKTTLFEKISEDIGSGNNGDMLDMQCTLNQDPSVTPPELLYRKENTAASDFAIQSMESTQESVLLEEGGSEGSIKREELTSSTRKVVLGENPQEDEIELMFKLME
jgi:hypothetical protein